MSLPPSLSRLITAVLVSTLLAACTQSQPTRFYTLFAPTAPERTIEGEPLTLGVELVSMPAYLDRPQIVTRLGASRMEVADFDQWAEPLEITVQRVLEENLSRRLESDVVATVQAPRDLRLDRLIEIEVKRYDANELGEAVLDAGWRLFDDDGRLLDSGRSTIRQQVAAPGNYEQIAEAMSLCLAGLSDEIAAAI
ncbi:MAG: PqiC family protein [Geminicoccaceae bacterium]